MSQSVRVLFAISSPLTLKALERLLEGTPDVEVVGIAKRSGEVPDLIASSSPQVVCVDDAPPLMDALELTRSIMNNQARPVLVLSATTDSKRRTSLLEAGALDVVARPSAAGTPSQNELRQFASKLRMLAHIPVIGRRPTGQSPTLSFSVETPTSSLPVSSPDSASHRIVAIGASTGGPVALMKILSALPSHFPHPIVCVQHVSKGFLEGLVSWLNDGCRLQVAIAEAGQTARPGTVLFPPEDRHLEVGVSGRIRLSDAPPRDGHRPSVTVLFESVAAAYGARSTAILLTGMGIDGAQGLVTIRDAGGETFAQDEASCVVFGMPRAAIERGAARHICPPEGIARHLLSSRSG